MRTSSGALFNVPGGGSSAIFGPDGRLIASAEQAGLSPTDEGIIYADLEMDDHLKARGFVDACGHYSRPDMLWLGVDAREKKHVRVEGERPQSAGAANYVGSEAGRGQGPLTSTNGVL